MPFSTPSVYEVGRLVTNWVGNGRSLTSNAATELSAFTNMIASRRRKVLAQKSTEFANVASGASLTGFYVGFNTGPECRSVSVAMLCLPANTSATGVIPRLQWTLLPGGVGPGTAQPAIHAGKRKTSTPVPDDMFWVVQRWDGKGGTTAPGSNQFYIAQLNRVYAKVMSVVVWEDPWSTFKTSTTLGVNPNSYITGAPLLDTPFDNLGDRMLTYWKQGGPSIFSWGRTDDSGGDLLFNTASYENAFDASLSDWNANGPGYWAYPRYQGSYHSNNVPCVFWAYGEAQSGTGTLALRAAAGVDLATLTIPSGGGVTYVETTFNLDATQDTQLLQMFGKEEAASSNILVRAFGVYQYSA